MPSLPDRLRRAARERTERWIRRRQGPDRDPIELVRNRIYILPTPLGLTYALMVFAMVGGGMNYNNNLALGFAFLLASLGLVAMHHTHGNLQGLQLRLRQARSACVGQPIRYGLLVSNPSARARTRIEFALGKELASTIDVPATGEAEAELTVTADRRGRVRLERFIVATRYPLGLFRAWAVIHPEYTALAWPRPAQRGRTPPGAPGGRTGQHARGSGDDDFAGLRPYQPGDPLRRIAWKTYARGRGLHVQQFSGSAVVTHVFDWDSLDPLPIEARLSQLCRWVLDAHERGEPYALRLPRAGVAMDSGPAHRERCLAALALFEAEGARV
jgi:uncharacterized protein (DUF58 family)